MSVPTRAVVAVTRDLESLDSSLWLESNRGPVLATGDVATVRAAAEDAGASLVAVLAGDGWRCYVREDECAVSVAGPELEDVARAVKSARRLACECREAGT